MGILSAGLFIPFLGLGLYRSVKTLDGNLRVVFYFLVVFLLSQGLVLHAIRYIVQILPFIAIFIARGWDEKSRRFYVSFAVVMLVSGLLITYQYISPFLPIERVPSFLSPVANSYFDANNVRKDAALLVADSTAENEIVIAGGAHWFWVYTHRNWAPLPRTEDEFWKIVNDTGARYVYTEPTEPYLGNNSKLDVVVKNLYVEVYRIN